MRGDADSSWTRNRDLTFIDVPGGRSTGIVIFRTTSLPDGFWR
ncbi:MAG: hypothetical protein N3C12_06870 [Candidatus Binatia bacterium]|nr:hypothetical protein [Candidatus Binatia bacterium]